MRTSLVTVYLTPYYHCDDKQVNTAEPINDSRDFQTGMTRTGHFSAAKEPSSRRQLYKGEQRPELTGSLNKIFKGSYP